MSMCDEYVRDYNAVGGNVQMIDANYINGHEKRCELGNWEKRGSNTWRFGRRGLAIPMIILIRICIHILVCITEILIFSR